jgi:Dna[CI] antecedent DciA-like protein
MRRFRQKAGAPETLEEILARAGESRFARAHSPIAAKLWREAVGARIAERACPLSLYGGVLLLRVPSSAWAHELSLLSDDICSRLRERGVKARELRFRVGPVPAVERPPERRVSRTVPATRNLPNEVVGSLGRVTDDELRAAIAGAAAANLAWQAMGTPAHRLAVNEAQRGARAPRSVEAESDPQGRESPVSREGAQDTREAAKRRWR